MKITATLYILFITWCSVTAQNQDSVLIKKENLYRRVKTDVLLASRSIAKTYAQPIQWKKSDFLMLAGTAVSVGVATQFDEIIYSHYKARSKSDFLLADIGDFMGKPEHNYPLVAGIWSAGIIANNDWLRDTGVILTASSLTTGILVTLLKEAIGRARPYTELGNSHFDPFRGEINFRSMPSGHTTLAWSTSWILAHQINFLPAKILFYAIPVVTAWSRVYDGAHWLSDVVLSTALSIACAEAVNRIYFELKSKDKLKFTLTEQGHPGVAFTIN